jgi:hypothetical protein
MKKVQHLNIRSSTFALEELIQLPQTIRQIELSGVRQLRPETLVGFFIANPQLEEVALSPLPKGQNVFASEEVIRGLATAIECLGNIQGLKKLTIGYIAHDPRTRLLEPLAGLVNLQHLQIRDCFCINNHCLKRILENTTALESLSITDCVKITNYSSIAYCSRLKELEIEKTVQFCDQDLEDIMLNGSLIKLRLRRCPNVTSHAIKELIKLCSLQELELSNCEEIDDTLLEELSGSQIQLSTFSLNGAVAITR